MKFFSYFNSFRPLSAQHPFIYYLRVRQKRFARYLYWYFSFHYFSKDKKEEKLDFCHFKHQSKLLKKLGETNLKWQINKIKNLQLAIEKLNGIIIYPGELFSFHRIVGKPTAKKGYLEGMELSFGEARPGIGGGLCQLSNLIHWMVLHSPLKVIERSNHSFDPFPDEGRVLPFGSGAALFYNYIDIILYNPTSITFQLNFWLTEKLLNGEIRANKPSLVKYHIFEKNHQFIKRKGRYYRSNEIWQSITEKGHNPSLLASRCLYKNFVIVKYQPPGS